jgi:DNA-binding response OmpR family regulator
MKILFADDDPLMHQIYKPYIERAGFQWVGTSDGRQAIEAAARETPCVAIIDIGMPEVDGISAILELRKSEATKAMPVIVITGEPANYARKRQFADMGATMFLAKPFGTGQLLEAIARALAAPANAQL